MPHRRAIVATSINPRPEIERGSGALTIGSTGLASRTDSRTMSSFDDTETTNSDRACTTAFVASSATTIDRVVDQPGMTPRRKGLGDEVPSPLGA